MAENETNKPQKGSWGNISTDESDKKPKVEFEMNKEVIVSFGNEFVEPREYPNQNSDGVFYVFDVKQNGEEKVIMTSAWTLLKGLKTLGNLADKNVSIKKIMKDGKQTYEVKNLDNVETQKI